MVMGKDKRYFDREFKHEAIRLVNEGKRSLGDNARDLDIHPNLLHQWRRKYRADMEHAFPGKGHLKPPDLPPDLVPYVKLEFSHFLFFNSSTSPVPEDDNSMNCVA
jgi:transposase-like protein